MSGWIKLHRKIIDNPLYFSEPFNRNSAWIDMLLIANHTGNYFFKRGIRVDVEIGQIGYDLDTLAKRWKWSRGKVERFLIMLENDNQIVRQKTNVTTLISIVNYSEYQSNDKTNDKANEKANGNKQECIRNKKENTYRAFAHLSMSLEEYNKLLETYNEEQINKTLDEIENYSGNKKYKSLYLTASKWLGKNFPKGKQEDLSIDMQQTNFILKMLNFKDDPNKYKNQ